MQHPAGPCGRSQPWGVLVVGGTIGVTVDGREVGRRGRQRLLFRGVVLGKDTEKRGMPGQGVGEQGAVRGCAE